MSKSVKVCPQRSRGSEMPQRQSPRTPLQLRTPSSESDGLHPTNRPIVDRSPKLGDRRSPRGPLPEKRSPRITDLQSQLNQTQEELKKLKEQLASAEAAKRDAQEELEIIKNQIPAVDPQEINEPDAKEETNYPPPEENIIDENSPETDVFEVPAVAIPVELEVEPSHIPEPGDFETKPNDECSELVAEPENDEVLELKAKLEEKEKVVERFQTENDELKREVLEARAEASMAGVKEEEAALKLSQTRDELDEAKTGAARLKEELEASEGAKLVMEAEMRRLKVQTEQWRKAADAAAAVLAGGVDGNGRRVRERCGSMDKNMGGFESDGYASFGSPIADGYDDGFGGGKRKGGGIRMFGDLWKKKGQK
ncbi:interactor of constitutive active ROPs 4-like isoform X2 [Tasmannia lanceolata]|uniref:interactor of constitutive active ROPs 4-like isoform X2 n=1 Tax=Tasmannia lanceolata TaxID=3420 RepID=UPI0040648BC0